MTSPTAIATSLRALLDAQRSVFLADPPDYDVRMRALATLRDAVRAREHELVLAISDDFGGRSHEETLALELFPFYDQIRHARANLKKWMRARRVPSSWFLQPSTAYYQYQPLGVAGVIGAWNYQLQLTLAPVIDAIAAGNHVIMKPSEITPRSADTIASIISEAFPPDYICCITGGPDVATAFSSMPFDHLFFTGSTRVGKLVMEAAAKNLTPVTLELGGKSPAIIADHYPLKRAVSRIMATKLYNAGQTCVAPDYVLLPAGREAEFEAEVREAVQRQYPALVSNDDYTRIVNEAHYLRLVAATDDAAQRGARVVTINPADEACALENRVVCPTLVFDTTDDMTIRQDEIFGPILPVVTYHDLDEAIAYVNARPRPLALYYFDNNRQRVRDLIARTMSGGVTVNDCLLHLAQHHLPFGGVGPSGMGQYHGFDGFVTFSKKRAVMVQSRFSAASALQAPFTPAKRRIIDTLTAFASRS